MVAFLFDRSIYINREHYIQEVAGLDDAFDLLDEWPQAQRNMVYEVVSKACRDALIGTLPMGVAQETFRRFAKKAGTLIEAEDMPSFGRSGASRNLPET